ncbi:hypothetical protein T10_9055 [Trichinella papuae]|uniref:Uncharacterized protein n=1 Tax=Trichinella papuae TaxID=268474 RepID=A0A0V1LY40_9BILA|nr:hypothetical protein T10_9055 [Trichinella papuae]
MSFLPDHLDQCTKFSIYSVSRCNHSVLAFTAFNSCGTWILATRQTFRFYLYGATIFWYEFPS